MTIQEYRRYACKLLGGIYDKELLSFENYKKIIAMIKARELELWEINPEILKLRLFHPELIEESEKYLNSKPVKQRPLIDSEYYWMYQLIPAPPCLEDFNDYFVHAIETHDHSFFSAFPLDIFLVVFSKWYSFINCCHQVWKTCRLVEYIFRNSSSVSL